MKDQKRRLSILSTMVRSHLQLTRQARRSLLAMHLGVPDDEQFARDAAELLARAGNSVSCMILGNAIAVLFDALAERFPRRAHPIVLDLLRVMGYEIPGGMNGVLELSQYIKEFRMLPWVTEDDIEMTEALGSIVPPAAS